MTGVSRDNRLSREARDCADHGVHVPHWTPPTFKVCHDAPVFLSRRTVQRKDRERAEHGTHAGKGPSGIRREVGSSEEFGHVDCGRGDRFAPTREDRQLSQRIRMAPDEPNETIRVEDCH